MQRLMRWCRHGFFGSWHRDHCFPATTLEAVTAAIRQCESRHPGEIRFAVEAALPLAAIWRRQTPRERAIEVFAREHVWDTAHNNGVLIYVLLAEHDVEIVADRGAGNARVPPAEWEHCCRVMETHFRAGAFEAGAIAGVEAVADVLRRFPPTQADAGNELPDQPILL